jgi:hypothetical protein
MSEVVLIKGYKFKISESNLQLVVHSRQARKSSERGKTLKGLSYEIDFKTFDKNLQILALIRAGASF